LQEDAVEDEGVLSEEDLSDEEADSAGPVKKRVQNIWWPTRETTESKSQAARAGIATEAASGRPELTYMTYVHTAVRTTGRHRQLSVGPAAALA
jgi:hypothetical protein